MSTMAPHDNIQPVAAEQHANNFEDNLYQDISGRVVNPTKLTAFLKTRFGIGSYEIHVSFSCL
jgi:hypothetical protein